MTDIATARELAARGFNVFPIKPGAKFPPLWTDWPSKATRDIPADWPADANVGIHCAGLAVIDVDVAKGGADSLTELDLSTPGLPPTLTCLTPRGGFHLFYRLPEDHPGVPNSVERLGTGLDVRSTGGYVVGAGSGLYSANDLQPLRYYRWENPDTPIAPIPDWLLAKLGETQPKSESAGANVPDADPATVDRATAWLEARPGAVEGQGGDAFTFGTAAFLRDFGLSAGQAYTLMLEQWNPRCSPPWGPDDLWAKVVNAYRYAEGEPGAKAISAGDFPDVEPADRTQIENVRTQIGNKRAPVSMADISRSPITTIAYLVKGLLQQRSYAMLYGAPGEGKTFVALDIAYHVAAGREWMGKRVRQALVLYVGFEAYGGLANRVRGLRQKYGADVALYTVPGGFDLRNQEGRRALGEIIGQLPEKPKLIVFDTFAYALAGGDENSAQDVGAFNSAVQALIESTGACVLLIHHTGKDASKGARGSSALPAAIDTEIAVADRAITPTKQREAELGEPIGFKLTQVLIGMDEDGDSIVSCVVDAANIEERRNNAPRSNTNEGRVWDELIQRRPTNEPIAMTELQDFCAVFLPAGDTRMRQAFRDAMRKLIDRRLIQIDEAGMITRVMA